MKLNSTRIIVLQWIKNKFDSLWDINSVHVTTREIQKNVTPLLKINRWSVSTALKQIEELWIIKLKRIKGWWYTVFKWKNYKEYMKNI